MAWTDDKVEMLTKLWNQGHSASVCAGRLNAAFPYQAPVSRNAIVGKAHRLGLTGRQVQTRMQSVVRPRKKKIKRLPKQTDNRFPMGNPAFRKLCAGAEPLVIANEIDVPLAERKSLMDLEAHDCRWPIGEPLHPFPLFYFCGKEKVPGLPYCEHHARRAFVSPEQQKAYLAAKRKLRKREVVDAEVVDA
jgi:GcrA cell cycle regulator